MKKTNQKELTHQQKMNLIRMRGKQRINLVRTHGKLRKIERMVSDITSLLDGSLKLEKQLDFLCKQVRKFDDAVMLQFFSSR